MLLHRINVIWVELRTFCKIIHIDRQLHVDQVDILAESILESLHLIASSCKGS